MKPLPEGLRAYRRTPSFTETTVPAALLADHATKQGVWGVITVERGQLDYTIAATGETHRLDPEAPGIVEPRVPHHVTPVGEVVFFVEFWR